MRNRNDRDAEMDCTHNNHQGGSHVDAPVVLVEVSIQTATSTIRSSSIPRQKAVHRSRDFAKWQSVNLEIAQIVQHCLVFILRARDILDGIGPNTLRHLSRLVPLLHTTETLQDKFIQQSVDVLLDKKEDPVQIRQHRWVDLPWNRGRLVDKRPHTSHPNVRIRNGVRD